jgi:hypothetical protein
VSKLNNFRDFDVLARVAGLTFDEERTVNLALSATSEPIRLWLKTQVIKAPFVKLVIRFEDEMGFDRSKPSVINVLGVCRVFEPVSSSLIRESAGDHRWVIAAIRPALRRLEKELAWRSEELEAFLDELAEKPLPLMHFFEKLARTDRRSRITCTPWQAFQPDLTEFGVRVALPGKPVRDVLVFSKRDVLLDADFPLAKSKLQDGTFLLLDKEGNTLASVPIDERGMH